MGWPTGLAIYFIIWWTVLFAILPIGLRSQADDNRVVDGTPESAPSRFSFARTAALTSMVSLGVFALFYGVTEVLGVGPASFPNFLPNAQ
jgi:predicted secreted protein